MKDFDEGRIPPPIAVEMGLNYGNGHLASDAEKLLNSQVRHGYLVHFVRGPSHDPFVDQTIDRLFPEPTIRVAFARIERKGRFVKYLDEPKIHSA